MPEPTSTITLSRQALAQNLSYLRALCQQPTRVFHVVKGNAYGHGLTTFVPLCVELGAMNFATFDAHEAHHVVRHVPAGGRVLVMGMLSPDEVKWAVQEGIEFYVYNSERLKLAKEAAEHYGRPAKVHIELETGMNRTGFRESHWAHLATNLRTGSKALDIRGFCTHFAGAEEIENMERVRLQLATFFRGVEFFKEAGIHPGQLHTACSAATVRLPEARLDFVRVGILQYGFWPSPEIRAEVLSNPSTTGDPLRRVLSWSSRLMDVHEVSEGEYVGYGTGYLCPADMRVGVVPVGYAHGFSRGLSNLGRVLIGGKRVPVIGTVNMNVLMVDLTHVPQAAVGDEVVLIGQQGDLSISVASFASASNQLNYELLTRLPANIPRKIIP